MALYSLLFGLSIFMIALVMAVIKKMFFRWKEEHKIERLSVIAVDRPSVSVIIYADKCIVRRRQYKEDIAIYDIITKSDIGLPKNFKTPAPE